MAQVEGSTLKAALESSPDRSNVSSSPMRRAEAASQAVVPLGAVPATKIGVPRGMAVVEPSPPASSV